MRFHPHSGPRHMRNGPLHGNDTDDRRWETGEIGALLADPDDDPDADRLLRPGGDLDDDEAERIQRTEAFTRRDHPDHAASVARIAEFNDARAGIHRPAARPGGRDRSGGAPTATGEPLAAAAARIGKRLRPLEQSHGRPAAVRMLQNALALAPQTDEARQAIAAPGSPARSPFASDGTAPARSPYKPHPVFSDGKLGPKTKRAVRQTLVAYGRPALERAWADTVREDGPYLKPALTRAQTDALARVTAGLPDPGSPIMPAHLTPRQTDALARTPAGMPEHDAPEQDAPEHGAPDPGRSVPAQAAADPTFWQRMQDGDIGGIAPATDRAADRQPPPEIPATAIDESSIRRHPLQKQQNGILGPELNTGQPPPAPVPAGDPAQFGHQPRQQTSPWEEETDPAAPMLDFASESLEEDDTDAERPEPDRGQQQPVWQPNLLTLHADDMSAASQGTSPHVIGGDGTPNYRLADEEMQTKLEWALHGDNPNYYWSQIDPETYVVLRDPRDGRIKVWHRDEEMNEGVFLSLGRLIAPSLLTSTITTPGRQATSALAREMTRIDPAQAERAGRAIGNTVRSAARAGTAAADSAIGAVRTAGEKTAAVARMAGKTALSFHKRNAAFAEWTRNIATGKILRQGHTAIVGRLDSKVRTFLQARGIEPATDAILVTDKQILHMLRANKTLKGKTLPIDMVERMPEILGRPRAVLWDKQKPGLWYVFDVPGHARKGKFVVRVGVGTKSQSGQARPTPNRVITGGLVPAENLRPSRATELIAGKPW